MTQARQPQEYIITADELQKLMSWSTHKSPGVCQYERRLEILRKVETRLHTSAPASTAIPLKSCFGDFDDCPCDDECSVSEFCAFYCKKKSVNSCGMTESQCGMVQEHEKAEAAKAARERTIKEFELWNPFQQSFKDFVESLRLPEPQQEGRLR